MPTDPVSPVILGAAIGATASLLGGWLAGWRQSKLEEDKWARGRKDVVRTDTRAALTSLAKCLASTSHSVMWSTYKAINSAEFSDEELAAYEQEFHQSVSELVGAQMLIAALDHSLYARVTPLVSEAIRLGGDGYVALKAATFDAPAGETELAEVNSKALALIKRVPDEVANLLQGA